MQRINITLGYQVRGAAASRSLALMPEDYFDLDTLEPNESIDMHCVSKHLDPRAYIKRSTDEIQQIEIVIKDALTGEHITSHFTYWNHGKCELHLRTTNIPGELPWQLTLQMGLPNETLVTAKFAKEGEVIIPIDYLVNVGDELKECLPDDETPDWKTLLNDARQRIAAS